MRLGKLNDFTYKLLTIRKQDHGEINGLYIRKAEPSTFMLDKVKKLSLNQKEAF